MNGSSQSEEYILPTQTILIACEWTGLRNQKNISYSPRQYWCLHLWSRSSPSSDMRRGEVVQRKEYWRTYSGTNRQQNSVWVIPRCTTPKHSVVPHVHRTRLRIRWPAIFSVCTCGYVCVYFWKEHSTWMTHLILAFTPLDVRCSLVKSCRSELRSVRAWLRFREDPLHPAIPLVVGSWRRYKRKLWLKCTQRILLQ